MSKIYKHKKLGWIAKETTDGTESCYDIKECRRYADTTLIENSEDREEIKESVVPDVDYIGDMEITATQSRPTVELSEASLAMSQLAQLRNETRRRDGDWEPDWKNYHEWKFCLIVDKGKLVCGMFTHIQQFLAFRTKEIAEEFLEKHVGLIEKYRPLS